MKNSNLTIRLTTLFPTTSLLSVIFIFGIFSSSFAQNSLEIAQSDSQPKSPISTFSAPQQTLKTRGISFKTKIHPDLMLGFASNERVEDNNLSLVNVEEGEVQFVLETGFEGAIRIKNLVTGKYLEVTDDMAIHGGLIGQGERRNSSSQQFQLVSLGDGYYSLVSHLNYNLALEVPNQGGVGAPMVLKNRKKTDNQAFKLIQN